MKNKNRITLLNFLSNLLLRGISIFSAPVFSRLLGTSGFGIVSVYNIWTRILGVAVPMQSNLTLVNARVEYPEDQHDAYQSSVLTMSLLMFAAAIGDDKPNIERIYKEGFLDITDINKLPMFLTKLVVNYLKQI